MPEGGRDRQSITIDLIISICKLFDGTRTYGGDRVNYYFVPYYVNIVQSDIRGIKCGWYSMDECGKLGSGPFPSAIECLGTDSQVKNGLTPKWLH